MARIVVLGAGFAGLWSAVGAARKRDEIGTSASDLEIVVVDRNPYHNIRVRNYEADLGDVAIPLADVLDPIGVRHMVSEVRAVDPDARCVTIATTQGEERLAYDRLVMALGSRLTRPQIPGLAAHAFDVDTYASASKLNAHIATLKGAKESSGYDVVVVAGAGFTGIEVAADMPARLNQAFSGHKGRVILLDTSPVVGAGIGAHARPIIEEALAALGIETRLGVGLAAVDASGVRLTNGEMIPTRTLIWCAGMRASPLAATLPAACDALGRVLVDDFMRVPELPGVFAAGDTASSLIDGTNPTIMSCQYARPMGRFAGHNVVADLYARPLLALQIDWYVTVLDLGPWGALYTVGRDRRVLTSGPAAKVTKETINRIRIYPPRDGSAAAILEAAAPIVQAPPPDVREALRRS